MAALIKAETGIEPTLIVGGRGEFTVWVGEHTVAKKGTFGFPSDEEIVAAIRQELASSERA